MRPRNRLDAFSRFMTPADFFFLISGPRCKCLRVPLLGLCHYRITVVLAVIGNRARLPAADGGSGPAGINCMSQRGKYSAQAFEESA